MKSFAIIKKNVKYIMLYKICYILHDFYSKPKLILFWVMENKFPTNDPKQQIIFISLLLRVQVCRVVRLILD